MHPPAGGSSAFEGFFALPFDELSRFLVVLPRRVTRATATGVMLPTHNPLLRYSAALPTLFLLLLLLSEPSPASSSPSICHLGQTYWDSLRQACISCTRCLTPEAPYVLIPCQPHRDVQCGTLSALRIDWSGMRSPRVKQQKFLRAQYQRSSTPSVQPATSPPHRPGLARKVPRPRTPEGRGLVLESAARLTESRDPQRVSAEGVVIPSVREEEAAWTWQHWLVAGVAMVTVCAAVLFLAPLAARRMRGWERCSSSVKHKPRCPESRKRQFNKVDITDHGAAKGSKGEFSEGGDRFYSDNQHILVMDEILLDRKKAAAWGSLRDESTNLYVENTPVKELAPASSVTVATMTSGRLPSVKVGLQGGSTHRNFATNCLRLGCASRTELTERSSAV